MRIKSIKTLLYLFITALVLLSGFYLLTLYFNLTNWKADETYHQILELEKDFFSFIVNEKVALKTDASYRRLKDAYDPFQKEIKKAGLEKELSLLVHRLLLLEKLYDTHQNIRRQHETVRGFLSELVQSVRYIHEHHIGYLKNLMRRGRIKQDWDVGEDFKRSPVEAAPEVEIIKVAVAIQNRLLDVFSIFYKLLAEEQPSMFKEEFQNKINAFYKAVNTFEDYSLDAQDGLLVEELLLKGRQFEKSFTVLLNSEAVFNAVSNEMADNSRMIIQKFHEERKKIEKKISRLENGLIVIQYISIFVFLVVIIGLSLYVYKMMNAFKRTREETEKIQHDIKYEIPVDSHDYTEFRIIFETLNTMARTIENQIDDLNNARTQLSIKVKERTIELERTNEKLLKEIRERIESVNARIELEKKLNRAKKMEAIGLLAGGVAHDLNNILSGIVSYPELMLMDIPEESPLRESVLTIKRTGEKAATIVQDLLTLSRSSISVTEIVNINDLTREFLNSPEFNRIKSYHDNIQIETKLNPDLLNIIGAPVHLSKTIMNLVINALEAMPDGGTVSIETSNQYVDRPIAAYDDVEEGDYVLISVTDNGVGMSTTDIERIFEPFYSKKVLGRSGTGLGMAVVWGTVKDHNGYIDIISEENKGSQIKIYLPVSRRAQQKPQKELSLDDIKGNGERVLVIDDVKEQREIASKMLEALGYEVETISSGEEAVEYLKDNSFDMIVLDMIMDPGLNGLETYRSILEIRPGQKAIIASGYSESDKVRRAQKLGAGAYIRKPYTLKNLGIAIHREMNRASG